MAPFTAPSFHSPLYTLYSCIKLRFYMKVIYVYMDALLTFVIWLDPYIWSLDKLYGITFAYICLFFKINTARIIYLIYFNIKDFWERWKATRYLRF